MSTGKPPHRNTNHDSDPATRQSKKGFTLTTEKGRTIEVYSGSFLNIYAGRYRLGMGRTFHGETIKERFSKAIAAYKSPEIKSALQLLLSTIIAG